MARSKKPLDLPQTGVPLPPESPDDLTDKKLDRIHKELLRSLYLINAEALEMDQALQEIRKVADPELGIPRPKAWKAILRRHPALPLPDEPNLSYAQELELADKLRASGRLKRVRSEYWNPWEKQDNAKDKAWLEAHNIINAAYDGKIGLEEWKAFRRKHPSWNLPKKLGFTLKEYFDALDKLPDSSGCDYYGRSLYSLIRWTKKQ